MSGAPRSIKLLAAEAEQEDPAFSEYKGNVIRTQQYASWLVFPFVNVQDQLKHGANMYFLVILLLQLLTTGKTTMCVPLSIVLGVNMIKDAVEEYKRQRADSEENGRPVTRLWPSASGGNVAWRDLRPGDVVRLKRDDRVPADLLLLRSSEQDGSCNVETMSLDGETNHKPKWRPDGCRLERWEKLPSYRDYLTFEEPRGDLYNFRANLCYRGKRDPVALSINNLLLRGSVLYTDWVEGLVVYCGHETRIKMNEKQGRYKRSQLDKDMNWRIVLVLVIGLVLSLVSGLFHEVWELWWGHRHWYLMLDASASTGKFEQCLVKLGTMILQMSNMVPISLIVAMTAAKFLQSWTIQRDREMRGADGTQAAEVHCSQVLESLGQITHVFSDKTGTLTNNEIRFKSCSINGLKYGEGTSGASSQVGFSADPYIDFSGKDALLHDIEHSSEASDIYANFLLCQAICHTVTLRSGEYVGSSPDEIALVSAAKFVGLQYIGGDSQNIELLVTERRLDRVLHGVCGTGVSHDADWTLTVKLLAVCDFDNRRNRMSVVVRYPNGNLVLLIKGADNALWPLVEGESGTTSESQNDAPKRHIIEYSRAGLRTLCLGCSRLRNEGAYLRWRKQHDEALAAAPEDPDRGQKTVSDCSAALEMQERVTFLGATAQEDRLQDRVPEVIEHLRQAGIKVWMLTGDKMETAISIGLSCKLLEQDWEHLAVLDVDTLYSWECRSPHVITITGDVLGKVMQNAAHKSKFYDVAGGCEAVVCCRVSPKQKGEVVALVQERHASRPGGEHPVTLAIGDGANDVAMITQADVGIGLFGKEGQQAARPADFAFKQFHFLERLLFVWGHQCYRRNTILVLYIFYKNMLLVIPPFAFYIFMSFSAQPFYEPTLYMLFNIVYTGLPIVVYAFSDLPEDEVADWLRKYRPGGQKPNFFGRSVFVRWMLLACLQGVVLTWAALSFLSDGSRGPDGLVSGDLWSVGAIIFLWVIVGAYITLAQQLTVVVPAMVVSVLLSVLCHPGFLLLMDRPLSCASLRGAFHFIYESPHGRVGAASLLTYSCHALVGALCKCLGERPVAAKQRRPGPDDVRQIGGRQERDVDVGFYTPLPPVPEERRRKSRVFGTHSTPGFHLDKAADLITHSTGVAKSEMFHNEMRALEDDDDAASDTVV